MSGEVIKIYGINHTIYVLASGTYCSNHLLYINVCKVLCMTVAFSNVMIISSQILGKLSFGSAQAKKRKKMQLVLI